MVPNGLSSQRKKDVLITEMWEGRTSETEGAAVAISHLVILNWGCPEAHEQSKGEGFPCIRTFPQEWGPETENYMLSGISMRRGGTLGDANDTFVASVSTGRDLSAARREGDTALDY